MTTVPVSTSRVRVDLFAAGCGLLTIPVVSLVVWTEFFGLNVGMILLSSLSALGSLAAVLCALFVGGKPPKELAPAAGARRGVRAGLLTIIVGGATFVLLGTLISIGIFGATVLPALFEIAFLTLLFLTILPVLFCSMVSGWLTGLIERSFRAQPSLEEVDPPEQPPAEGATGKPPIWKTVLPYVFLLSGFCYASPFLTLLISAEEETIAVQTLEEVPPSEASKTLPSQTPQSEPEPPPPPYKYVVPATFGSAGAERIAVIRRETVAGVIATAPARFSPDGKMLAYCRQRFRSVSVVTVRSNDRQVVSSHKMANMPTALAWSQDSQRVFYLSDDNGRYAGVLDIAKESNIRLPIPTGERIPTKARLVWPFAEELWFATSGSPSAFLDLKSLRVRPIKESKHWSGLTLEQRNDLNSRAFDSFYTSNRWMLRPHEFVTSYQPPSHFQSRWTHRTKVQMAVEDFEFAYDRQLNIGAINQGDRLLATPDRSVFVHLRNKEARFLYMGLQEQPKLRVSFPTSELFPDGSMPKTLESHLKSQTLWAFICPPVTNPLTDEIVGPDRSRVRAIARMAILDAGKVEFWIAEEYEPVREGDLVADLHSWRNNEPRSLGIPEVEGWWKPVLDFGTLETGLVVGRNRLPSRADRNTFVSEPTPNRPTALDPVRGQATENLIRNFVALHHQKVSNRDLDGYVADYAMKTDYFGTKKVSRQTIREDQGKYFAKYSRKITETIKGRVAVRGLGNELYEAKYDLNSSAAGKEEWNWISATSEVTLGIQILDESPQIVSQSAKVRDVEHGEP